MYIKCLQKLNCTLYLYIYFRVNYSNTNSLYAMNAAVIKLMCNSFFLHSSVHFRPKLKNVDRSSAQQLAITVGNVTVIITDFKEKTRSSSTSSSTVASSAGSEQQHLSSSSESTEKGSSRASTPRKDHSSGHNETIWRGRDAHTGSHLARPGAPTATLITVHGRGIFPIHSDNVHLDTSAEVYLSKTLVEHLVDWCVDVHVSHCHAETHCIFCALLLPDIIHVCAPQKSALPSLHYYCSLSLNHADGCFDLCLERRSVYAKCTVSELIPPSLRQLRVNDLLLRLFVESEFSTIRSR